MIHFKIYQADKSSPTGFKILFQPYETLQNENIALSLDDYKRVYEGDFEEKTDCNLPVVEQIFAKFNISRPEDFRGHSLSISDIIEIDGSYFFCDRFSFKEVFPEISSKGCQQKKKENLNDVVSRILKDGKLYGEVSVDSEGKVTILVEWGDWKHEHGYLRYLMQQNGFREIGENITEEDGSDCYSSIHTFRRVA